MANLKKISSCPAGSCRDTAGPAAATWHNSHANSWRNMANCKSDLNSSRVWLQVSTLNRPQPTCVEPYEFGDTQCQNVDAGKIGLVASPSCCNDQKMSFLKLLEMRRRKDGDLHRWVTMAENEDTNQRTVYWFTLIITKPSVCCITGAINNFEPCHRLLASASGSSCKRRKVPGPLRGETAITGNRNKQAST